MKKNTITLCAIIVVLSMLILGSCRKEVFDSDFSKNNPELIAKAKNWFDTSAAAKATTVFLTKSNYNWQAAQTFTFKNGYQAVVVPMDAPLINNSYKGIRYLYLYPWKNGKGFYTNVFDLLPTKQHLNKYNGKINLSKFDGHILSFSLTKGFNAGLAYIEGKPVANLKVSINPDQTSINIVDYKKLAEVVVTSTISNGGNSSGSTSALLAYLATLNPGDPPDPNALFGYISGSCGYCGWEYTGEPEGDPGTYFPPGGSSNPPPLTHCDSLRIIGVEMSLLYWYANMDSAINAIPNLATDTLEKGFPIYTRFYRQSTPPYDTVTTTSYTGTVHTGTTNTTAYTPAWPSWTFITAFLHSHPPAGYTCFSPGDLDDLILDNNYYPEFYGHYVVAANGTQYAMSVTNKASATAFLNQYNNRFDSTTKGWKPTSDIGIAFEKARIHYEKNVYINNPDAKNLAYEMAMSAVLEQFNSGVTIFKKNANDIFEPLVVNTTIIPKQGRKPEQRIYTQDCL